MTLPLILLAHLLGILTAVRALFTARTPQGATAWTLFLVLVPYLAVPTYWLMGSSRFQGYLTARKGESSELRRRVGPAIRRMHRHVVPVADGRGSVSAAERIVGLRTLGGNATRLLVDGQETFTDLFEGIARARRSIVVQFYILRGDGVGQELKRRLAERARAGVQVLVLYDRIGSFTLPWRYTRELEEAGAVVHAFRSTRFGRPTPFQVNFRNHRKVVVVDGRVGWMGGLNVGEEYLGRHPTLTPWRDTHLRVEGPAALQLQLSFVEDWYWATQSLPDLPWEPVCAGDEPVLVLPSGPESPGDTTGLLTLLAIHQARRRLWIATPYFLPTDAVVEALTLAAFRGVDVRILMGARSDSRFMDVARYPAMSRLLRAGVRVLGFEDGYFHAKAVVIDDLAAGVGTVNLDHRSLRLNFEITAMLFGRSAIEKVASSFERDFASSREFTLDEIEARGIPARILSQAAQLAAPIL